MTTTKRQRTADRALQALKAMPKNHPSRTRPEGGGKSEWAQAYGYLMAEKAAAYGSYTHLPNVGPPPPPMALQLFRENE